MKWVIQLLQCFSRHGRRSSVNYQSWRNFRSRQLGLSDCWRMLVRRREAVVSKATSAARKWCCPGNNGWWHQRPLGVGSLEWAKQPPNLYKEGSKDQNSHKLPGECLGEPIKPYKTTHFKQCQCGFRPPWLLVLESWSLTQRQQTSCKMWRCLGAIAVTWVLTVNQWAQVVNCITRIYVL